MRAKIVRGYLEGATGPELAARYGLAVGTVYYYLTRAGVRRRPTNHSRMVKVSIPELRRLLQGRTMTIEQIASHFRVSIPSIVRRMRKHGLRSHRGHGSPLETNFFWNGGRRREKEGYVLVKVPDHPYATKQGYVREHRLVVEKLLGRHLLPTEVVHHKDGNPTNNAPDNLEVFSTHANHMRHEWTENWYPQIEQLRAKFRRKRRPRLTASQKASGTDVAA